VITADRELHPIDDLGVRDAFMQAFRLRGIVPEDALYFSEDALSWPRVSWSALPPVEGLIFGDPNGLTSAEKDHNADVLRRYARKNARMLGFRPGEFISVPSFHPTFRLAPDGRLRVDMVVEMSQKCEVPFDRNKPELGSFPLRAGVALLIAKPPYLAGKEAAARISYLIQKPFDQTNREERQRQFSLRAGLLEGKDPKRFEINFNLLHGMF